MWFYRYLRLLGEIYSPSRSDSLDAITPEDGPTLATGYFDKQRQKECAATESAIFMWASKRRFAVTKGGRMALVPNSAREGDIIVIAAGSRVPHVLRSTSPQPGENYITVGEAFIDEFMDGSFLSIFLKNQGKVEKDWTALRRFKVV